MPISFDNPMIPTPGGTFLRAVGNRRVQAVVEPFQIQKFVVPNGVIEDHFTRYQPTPFALFAVSPKGQRSVVAWGSNQDLTSMIVGRETPIEPESRLEIHQVVPKPEERKIPPNYVGDKKPATCLTWYEKVFFAQVQGWDLPSAVQREWVARAGEHGFEFGTSTGDLLLDGAMKLAYLDVNGPADVDDPRCPPNPFGVHLLVANVWETTREMTHEGLILVSGGCWRFLIRDFFRAAYFRDNITGARDNDVGFRCVINRNTFDKPTANA